MKKVIIFQSLPIWLGIIKDAINEAFPEKVPDVDYSETFDQCLGLIPKEGEVLVICSSIFHGDDSPYKKGLSEEDKKDADTLARLIKEINKKAKVWVYSEYPPKTIIHIDGFISKDFYNESLKKVVKLIKKDCFI